jgi:hypothetical protein
MRMKQYRAYLRNSDGQLFQFHVIRANSDEAAITAAEQHVFNGDVEVRQQSRVVAVLAHQPNGK